MQAMIFMTSNLGARNHRADDGRNGLCSSDDTRETRLNEKVERWRRKRRNGVRSGVHEPNRQDSSFPALCGSSWNESWRSNLHWCNSAYWRRRGDTSCFRATRAARISCYAKDGPKYGARHLKRTIERHLVYPLASLLATDQVTTGETISVTGMG